MSKEKKWILKDAGDAETVSRLSSELGVDPVLSELLTQRGIRTFQEARDFFRPDLGNLHDPFLMKDMDKAIERILRAKENAETVTIYGDYDVDGITATCLLTDFLRREGGKVVPYIPNRLEEGYGLNREAAAQYGLTAAAIGGAVRSELTGSEATSVTIDSKELRTEQKMNYKQGGNPHV